MIPISIILDYFFIATIRWLQDFAYRISMNLFVFFVAAVEALAIALVTVCIQGIRAAVANPANSLRNE